MNGRVVWAIARKDLREVLANPSAWRPALVLPASTCILVPLLVLVLPHWLPPPQHAKPIEAEWMRQAIAALPAAQAAILRQAPYTDRVGLLVTGQLLAPMFLLIPLMVACLIGANAFVGEKERKTLEALLYTPATDAELFVGKTLAALVPSLVLSWVGFGVYTLVVNAAAWPVLHRMWFPTPAWWPLIAWVSPAIASLGLIITVLVSSRAASFVEANQKLSLLVFPLMGLVVSQAAGAVMLTARMGWLIGAGVWALDAVLLFLAIRSMRRTTLMTRL